MVCACGLQVSACQMKTEDWRRPFHCTAGNVLQICCSALFPAVGGVFYSLSTYCSSEVIHNKHWQTMAEWDCISTLVWMLAVRENCCSEDNFNKRCETVRIVIRKKRKTSLNKSNQTQLLLLPRYIFSSLALDL